MEIICIVPKNTKTLTTRNSGIDLSWKLCRTEKHKHGDHRKLRNWPVIEIVSHQKTQTRVPQEPKKSSLTHSLLQAVILVQSEHVTKIWHGAKIFTERCLIHLVCVLLSVKREVPRKRNVHTDICVWYSPLVTKL